MRCTLMNIINNVQIVVYFHLHAIKILPVENKYLQIYYKKFEYFYTCLPILSHIEWNYLGQKVSFLDHEKM